MRERERKKKRFRLGGLYSSPLSKACTDEEENIPLSAKGGGKSSILTCFIGERSREMRFRSVPFFSSRHFFFSLWNFSHHIIMPQRGGESQFHSFRIFMQWAALLPITERKRGKERGSNNRGDSTEAFRSNNIQLPKDGPLPLLLLLLLPLLFPQAVFSQRCIGALLLLLSSSLLFPSSMATLHGFYGWKRGGGERGGGSGGHQLMGLFRFFKEVLSYVFSSEVEPSIVYEVTKRTRSDTSMKCSSIVPVALCRTRTERYENK